MILDILKSNKMKTIYIKKQKDGNWMQDFAEGFFLKNFQSFHAKEGDKRHSGSKVYWVKGMERTIKKIGFNETKDDN